MSHARLSASGMYRWANCPGSVSLEEQIPEGPPSVYAQEGLAAHAEAEDVLEAHRAGRVYDLNGLEHETRPYLEHCLAMMDDDGVLYWIEERVNLDVKDENMFGTLDFAAYDRQFNILFVEDLKYGKGVRVNAAGNDQLRYYALGKLEALEKSGYRVDEIVLKIWQPRISDQPSSEKLSSQELKKWKAEKLLPAVRRVHEEAGTLNDGPWCKFCSAKGACPKLRERATEIAKKQFGKVGSVDDMDVKLLDDKSLAQAMRDAEFYREWAASVEEETKRRCEANPNFPDWKLVPGRATRQWKDKDAALRALEELQLDRDDLLSYILKSPAQVEKIIQGSDNTDLQGLDITDLYESTCKTKKLVRIDPTSDFNAVTE